MNTVFLNPEFDSKFKDHGYVWLSLLSSQDIETLTIKDGDIVRVESTPIGGFELYYYPTSDSPLLVGAANGTVELNDYFWNKEVTNAGFDNDTYAETVYDLDYSHEVRNIMLGLINDMFVGDLLTKNNKLWFTIIEYILNEQSNVDWIFKTSFVSVLHKLKKLEQFPAFVQDNQTYYEDYINEVKPYRTSIREYLLDYQGSDEYVGDVTDFDVPAYFDPVLRVYRSPSGEYAQDVAALQQPQ